MIFGKSGSNRQQITFPFSCRLVCNGLNKFVLDRIEWNFNKELFQNFWRCAHWIRNMFPATGQKYAWNGMNSPHHITVSTNGPRSWYATSNLPVLGSHSLQRIFIPFYNLQTRLATAAGNGHPANTQAVEITQSNNLALLFLWFHLLHNFRRH
jgi:hypothetical protein